MLIKRSPRQTVISLVSTSCRAAFYIQVHVGCVIVKAPPPLPLPPPLLSACIWAAALRGWAVVMDASGETNLKVLNWKLRQCWDNVIDFSHPQCVACVCPDTGRNEWRGESMEWVGMGLGVRGAKKGVRRKGSCFWGRRDKMRLSVWHYQDDLHCSLMKLLL